MASFIIHTITGERLLKKLEELHNIELPDYEKKQFLLGNLIVDSINTSKEIPSNIEDKTNYKMVIKNKIRKEKLTTHFRDESKEGECIKAPNPNIFYNKYENLIKENMSVLGYLFHLYTDKLFFCNLFRESFETLDKEGNLTNLDKYLTTIRIIKSGMLVDAKEFWSGTNKINIYNDYTIINKLLLEHYGISFETTEYIDFAKENFNNPGIEEVNYKNITNILNEMQKYINDSYEYPNNDLTVFSSDKIIKFIDYVVDEFIKEYKLLLDEIVNKKGTKHDFCK